MCKFCFDLFHVTGKAALVMATVLLLNNEIVLNNQIAEILLAKLQYVFMPSVC